MTNAMETGSIHIQQSPRLPGFLRLGSDSLLKGWAEITNIRSTLDAETTKAGWISFFMAGTVEKAAFGLNRARTLGTALSRLAKCVRSGGCNSFEIAYVTTEQFLGVFRVTVVAHARHLQEGRGLLWEMKAL
jgi:hypothetical protein